jgi:hypothetical protein
VAQKKPPTRKTDDEVARSDRRWFLVAASIFAGSIGLMVGAHQVYRATGPHPEVTVFIADMKRVARRFIPRVRRPRKSEAFRPPG